MATPNHRSTAEELLGKARTYAPSSAARLATLAEAQVEALLALSEPEKPVPRPRKTAPAKGEAK